MFTILEEFGGGSRGKGEGYGAGETLPPTQDRQFAMGPFCLILCPCPGGDTVLAQGPLSSGDNKSSTHGKQWSPAPALPARSVGRHVGHLAHHVPFRTHNTSLLLTAEEAGTQGDPAPRSESHSP